MPRNGDFKKLVRARMAKTGESYTIARMQMEEASGNGTAAVADSQAPSGRAALDSQDARAIYQVKIALIDIEPEIWRTLLVPAATTLDRLHEIIQAAFGWWNYHMHQFVVDGRHYGVPDPEFADELPPMTDEREVTLADIAGADAIVYEYDFGDDWKHSIVIEGVVPSADIEMKHPVCTGGARACPHEDCGGTSGYRDMLKILVDPEHEENDSMRTWAGKAYDPENFDLAATNRALSKLRPRSAAARRRREARP